MIKDYPLFKAAAVQAGSRWDILGLGVREKEYEPAFPLEALEVATSVGLTAEVIGLMGKLKSLEAKLRAQEQKSEGKNRNKE
jgi:hypothetical protein